jgi:hypothetical protein
MPQSNQIMADPGEPISWHIVLLKQPLPIRFPMFKFLDVITWIIPAKMLLPRLMPPLTGLPGRFLPQQDDGFM